MRSYYWWEDFKVPDRQKTDAVRRLRENDPANQWEIFPQDLPFSTVGAAAPTPTKATLTGYLRAFGKQLTVMALWLTASVVFLLVYVPQLTCLGPGVILYFGMAMIGMVVCVGLPIKWYLGYRAAGGQVFCSEGVEKHEENVDR